MDLTLLITIAPLLAAIELLVGLMMLAQRESMGQDSVPRGERLFVANALIGAAGLWAVLGIVLHNPTGSVVGLLVPMLPYLAAVAVLGRIVFVWRKRTRRTATILHVLTDPERAKALPSDLKPMVARIRGLARRITMVGTSEIVLRAIFIGTVVAAVWLLIDRVLTDTRIDTLTGLIAPVVLALIGGLFAGWVLSRATPGDAAVRADIRLGLRERLSTALAIDGGSEFEQAVRRDALAHIRGAQWNQVAPFRWPWQGSASLAVGALLVLGVFVLQDWRLLDQEEPEPDITTLQSDEKKALRILESNKREMNELADAIGTEETKKLLQKMHGVIEDLSARPAPGESQQERDRKMLEKLSDLEDQADKLRQQLEALRKDAGDLAKTPGGDPQSPADRMRKKLGDENYKDAGKDLDDLEKKLKDWQDSSPGSQDKSDKGDQLKKEGEKLEKMSDQMSPDNPLKQDMKQLGQQLQNLQNLSPQQQQQLKQKMQQMQQQLNQMKDGSNLQMNQQMLNMLKDQLQGARQQFGQCDKQGNQPGQSPGQQNPKPGQQQGQGGQQGKDNNGQQPFNPDSLSKKQRDKLMDMLKDAQNQGNNQGQGNGNNPGNGQPGSGTDGRGRGGGNPGTDKPLDKYEQLPWLQRGPLHDGNVISSMRRMGIPEKGEARTEFESAWRTARRQAEDSMTRSSIPPEYRPLARRYFEQIHPGGGSSDD